LISHAEGKRSTVALQFCLPAVAEAEAEGLVVNWFKDEGQGVRRGELLLEVQFEKVNTEVTAPQDGVLARILSPQGTTVKVGQLLCVIEEAGAAAGAAVPVGEVRATPAAKRLARELGVPIAAVPGSGPGGRISEEDVKAFAAAQAADSAPAASTGAPGREPLTPAQRITGDRMLQSLRESAQFTLGRELDVSALLALRARLKETGSPISLSDLVHRAVVLALAGHPRLQAQLDGADLLIPDGVHLGIAVARGADLLVPVIKGAAGLGLPALAAERQRLTEAVKSGQVSAADLQGATFTISNLGAYGIDFFTPVLNPPQPAILGVGRTVERLVMAGQTIQAAQFMTFSLTVDHRVINGAAGAEFLATLAELVAAPGGWAASPRGDQLHL